MKEWFRTIKTFDGKPKNSFGYDERVLDDEFAMAIIEENRHEYNRLMRGEVTNESGFWLRD